MQFCAEDDRCLSAIHSHARSTCDMYAVSRNTIGHARISSIDHTIYEKDIVGKAWDIRMRCSVLYF